MLAKKEELYQAFRSRRNEQFALFPRKTEGQTQVGFALDIASLAQSAPERAKRAAKARQAGLAFIDFVLEHLAQLKEERTPEGKSYLPAQGYGEISNVYVHTAALQAREYQLSRGIDSELTNWLQVAALNYLEGQEKLVAVLGLIGPARAGINTAEEDPWPTDDIDDIVRQVGNSEVPQYLRRAARHVQAVLGPLAPIKGDLARQSAGTEQPPCGVCGPKAPEPPCGVCGPKAPEPPLTPKSCLAASAGRRPESRPESRAFSGAALKEARPLPSEPGPVVDPEFVAALAALAALAPRAEGEPETRYMLRIAALAAPQRRTYSPLDNACEKLRGAGRALLSQLRYEAELCDGVAATLAELYVYTAPLDAINWRAMKAPAFDIVRPDSWLEVAALNDSAGEGWVLQKRGAALRSPADPYAGTLFEEVDGLLRQETLAAVPLCVQANALRVKALYTP